jgi:hypothetical protein
VAGYGVNDELQNPRDIMINVKPGPGFLDFVEGLSHTDCTPSLPPPFPPSPPSPLAAEHSAASHPNLSAPHDFSHDHPEIHPFDAVWWRNDADNGWMFAAPRG